MVNNTYDPNKGNRKERRKKKAESRSIEKKFNKEFSNNNEWTRLKTEIYARANGLFHPIESLVASLKSRRETLAYMTQDEAAVFARNCSILQRDILAYKQELNNIYAIHADKSGDCKIEDWSIMLELTEKYFIFTTNFNSIISPVYDHIVDLLHILEHRRIIAEQDRQNTDVVEDGRFTEIKENENV